MPSSAAVGAPASEAAWTDSRYAARPCSPSSNFSVTRHVVSCTLHHVACSGPAEESLDLFLGPLSDACRMQSISAQAAKERFALCPIWTSTDFKTITCLTLISAPCELAPGSQRKNIWPVAILSRGEWADRCRVGPRHGANFRYTKTSIRGSEYRVGAKGPSTVPPRRAHRGTAIPSLDADGRSHGGVTGYYIPGHSAGLRNWGLRLACMYGALGTCRRSGRRV